MAVAVETVNDAGVKTGFRTRAGSGSQRVVGTDIAARGEPALWMLGGALALGISMILGFLLLILWNGALAFWPRPIEVVRLTNGNVFAGEPHRSESFRPPESAVRALPAPRAAAIAAADGFAKRTLYRTGNYDLYNEDFVWVPDYERAEVSRPADMMLFERLEWGPFIGDRKSVV